MQEDLEIQRSYFRVDPPLWRYLQDQPQEEESRLRLERIRNQFQEKKNNEIYKELGVHLHNNYFPWTVIYEILQGSDPTFRPVSLPIIGPLPLTSRRIIRTKIPREVFQRVLRLNGNRRIPVGNRETGVYWCCYNRSLPNLTNKNWPSGIDLFINEKKIALPNKQCGPLPADLKDFKGNGSDWLQVSINDVEHDWVLVLQQMQYFTIGELIKIITSTREIDISASWEDHKKRIFGLHSSNQSVKQRNSQNNTNRDMDIEQNLGNENEDKIDEDLKTQQVSISLKCPLGINRIRIPARGDTCSHLDCFDLEGFLGWAVQNHQKTVWKCPFCQNDLIFTDLIVDGFVKSILYKSPNYDGKVLVFSNGEWKHSKPKISQSNVILLEEDINISNNNTLETKNTFPNLNNNKKQNNNNSTKKVVKMNPYFDEDDDDDDDEDDNDDFYARNNEIIATREKNQKLLWQLRHEQKKQQEKQQKKQQEKQQIEKLYEERIFFTKRYLESMKPKKKKKKKLVYKLTGKSIH
ncbi:tonalli [Anaeramoeba flamelloides]|uniref:Tonalli n=1 Tax=Anaeramoeba flamelloides TaxID=1746091 RepID=A0ABQ8Z0U9_9EUKA|nr:tonalli [Anaeramoeba flamelloides]